MRQLLYAEINVFCILILLLLLSRVLKSADLQNNQRLFIGVLVSNILTFLTDLIWIFMDSGLLRLSALANFSINGLYYVQMGISALCWFTYSESVQNPKIAQNRTFQILSVLPVVLLTGMVVLSYRTGWLFYLDENNNYYRGKLYGLQMLVVYGYIVVTALHALHKAMNKQNGVNRAQYVTLASFAVFPLLFGTLQQLLPGTPLTCVGVTLSLLWIFIDFKEQQISIDPLTQLNNRSQLLKYLSGRLKRPVDNQKLFLLMLDVDAFKKINDQFGHVEGDSALVRVANVLKESCSDRNGFVCRYGGDEFIIITEAENRGEIELLCYRVDTALAAATLADQTPYKLQLSIGYAEYSDDMNSVQDLIRKADEALYHRKKARTYVQ
ncbi:MAG: GGDEF domain-containing protein [Oscillibacter sp.]